METMDEFLLYAQQGGIVTLTMNEPERRNPPTGNTEIPEFLAAIERIRADRGIRCVILTGNGPSFSAGGNVPDMQRHAAPDADALATREEYRRGIQRLALSLFELEVPMIAAVNGHPLGAGLDVACICDIRIASERGRFAEDFVKLGIIG